jgi:hypothetical protein
MSAPAAHVKSLHLLRACLREASYLPDAVARDHFRRYIVARFKAYQPKHNATASVAVQAVDKYRHRAFKRRHVSIINDRLSSLHRKAKKGLRVLQRANLGELGYLQKVLFFAYGRIGRRKYALLSDLLKPDPLLDGGAPTAVGPAPLQALYFSNKRYLQYLDAPRTGPNGNYLMGISDRYSRLRAVVKTQYHRGIAVHRELKGPVMKTPMHNIWMRPMPIMRARNNVRRWYAETMTRLLPPIPSDEWDSMHAMVLKEKKVSLTRRRTSLQSGKPQETFDEILTKGLRLDKLSKVDRPGRAITPHFMQRLYSRILQLCCKVEYNEQRKQWVAIWGEPIQGISAKIYNAPSDASLFAGVDAAGRTPQALKKAQQDPADQDPSLKIQPRNEKGEYVRFPFFAEYLPADNPLRMQLDEWKEKRAAAGNTHKMDKLRGR